MTTINKLICTLLLVTGFVQAQTTVTGKVVNYKNKAVSGAELYLDSTATQVITNKLGEYTLIVPENVKNLKVHSKKHGWLSSAYTNESKMDFMYLGPESAKKEKNNSNPQSLSVEKDKSTSSYRTIYDMMRGRIAGVIVQQDNTIIIRGINSIRNNSEPLFVVDGNVVFSIDYIVPSEVQSITVLKDAEASIYGSRGSSGVIVIKLKK
jgi:TonB-dependent SusC/RagA subfamily outer membrane receptor